MKPHELFEKMSAQTADEIFGWLQREEKPAYKASIAGLANQRNLRPVFVERKPPAERHAWMKSVLARKAGNTIAEHLLQSWLLRAHKGMLCEFLDSLGIAHSEEGTLEQIPSSPPPEKINAAIDHLLTKHKPESVAIYLHSFREMDSASDWPTLRERLTSDPTLALRA